MIRAGRRVGSRPVDETFPSVPLHAVAAVAGADVRGDPAAPVRDLAYDSGSVPAGALFFCIHGAHADGHDFAAAAVTAGAAALVVERWLELDAPQVRVGSVREAMGPMSAVVTGQPASAMTMVGITGTNGKTTTTYLLEAVLRAAGLVPGVIGTTGARVDGRPEPLARTTPEAPDLHRLLARMRVAGVGAVAMEVSSHALAQHRVGGIVFDVGLFTNLSQDHLDYHPTMEEYFAAKARLFSPAHARLGVVNADDPWGRRLLRDPSIAMTTFAVEGAADLRAEEVRSDAAGVAFRAGGVTVRSPLRGRFNVANCLGALAVARALGLDLAAAAQAIGDVRVVPGRMDPVETGQDFLVVVDYAHTPDSILNVLRAARPLATGRVIVVFGCGGDRDRAKRPLMGEAATSGADLTVLTSDNPRSEDPSAIIGEILPGAVLGGGAFVAEPDRRAAIRLALRQAGAGDVVVIAGKGHEAYQEIGGRVEPFDDRAVAHQELLAIRGSGK